jgi:DDE superfamily endonuclease
MFLLIYCTGGDAFEATQHLSKAHAPQLYKSSQEASTTSIMSVSSCDSSASEDSLLRCSSTDSDNNNKEIENVDEVAASRLPFLYTLFFRRRNYRRWKKRWSLPRCIWSDYVEELTHQNEFKVTFRMSLMSFNKLVQLLRPALTIDELQSSRASRGRKPVIPELVVAMSLRWLAGGHWPDIKKVYGISRSHFYFLRMKFMRAVMACPALEIRLPDSSDVVALKKLASDFEAQTSKPVFRGCVGVVDGLTALIKAPSAKEADNVLAYYSGHYKHDSLNVQAMSNYCGKFLYFAVSAPGSFPDSKALALTRLQQWINTLPMGYYVLADNAYILSEHTLIPFSGSQRDVPQNSCYNYLLSQLRIRIEQAFGQFSVKWRILRKPLETSLATSSLVLTTCARLHNFIIDNEWQCNEEVTTTCNEWQYNEEVTRTDVVGSLSEIFRPSLSRFEKQQGTSFLREHIVSYIERNGFRRPAYNRLRNDTINFEGYESEIELM